MDIDLMSPEQEIQEYIAGLRFHSQPPMSDTDPIDCNNGNVSLRLEPVTTARGFDPYKDRHLGRGKSRILARIVNVGSQNCQLFDIEPREFTYWWLHKDAAGNVSAVYGNEVTRGVLRTVARADRFSVRGYEGDHRMPDQATARWNDSTSSASLEPQFHLTSLSRPARAIAGASWLSCNQGCCTATSIN